MTEQENAVQEPQEKEQEDSRFKDGDIIELVRVRFPGQSKSVHFLVGKRKYAYGQKVVALSERGTAVGYINSFPYQVAFNKDLLPLRSISKPASDEDVFTHEGDYQKEREAEELCKNLIQKLKLDMEITHVDFTQFGRKVVFYFTAPERVDFRELVRELVGELKIRIELRQISIRDRAAALGGIGPCGRQLCCSTFLSNYGRVNIKMAKNQNLALISNRLNGLCGQIKCCTAYENDVYTEKRSHLPKEDAFIETRGGDRGKVLRLHLLSEQFDLLTDQGKIKRYMGSEYDSNRELPADWKFPDRLEHIVNETSDVVGKATKETKASFEEELWPDS